MAEKKLYEVMVQMDGDRQYWRGDKREMFPADAAHLLAIGALREVGGRKSESAPLNKAEAPAPENKAEDDAEHAAPRRGRPPRT